MFGDVFHHFIEKNKKNAFYKKRSYANLNELAMYYIGGLLKHAPAHVFLILNIQDAKIIETAKNAKKEFNVLDLRFADSLVL